MSKRFREAVDREFIDMRVRPELLRRILNQTVEREVVFIMKKRTAIITIALITIMLLTGVGFATGVVQSIISNMKGMIENEDAAKYEALETLAANPAHTQSLSQISGARFTLSQSYYDGEQIILGYSLDGLSPSADFNFGPTSEHFDDMENTTQGNTVLMLNLADELTEDEYNQFTTMLAQNGSAGVIYYNTYIGDHLYLADGTELPGNNQTEVDNGVYLEVMRPLPDEAKDKPALEIAINVKRTKCFYYQDAMGSYYLFERPKEERVMFSIPRSTDEIQWCSGSFASDSYSTAAILMMSPINVWVDISMITTSEWETVDELRQKGIDMIYAYDLVVNGVSHETLLLDRCEDENLRAFEGECTFDVSNCEELRLRPLYSIQGEVPEEDIVFGLK